MKNLKKIVSIMVMAAMLCTIQGMGLLGGVTAWAFDFWEVGYAVYPNNIITVDETVYDVYGDDIVDVDVYEVEENRVDVEVYYEGLGEDVFALVIGETKASVFGELVENDVVPLIVDGRTMLPARFVAENLGATADWDPETKVVTIKSETVEIKLTIDSTVATVNGEEEELDAPAMILGDRTYTPVRFVAEKLGAKVDWNDAFKMVLITKVVAEEPAEETTDEEKTADENTEEVTDEEKTADKNAEEVTDEEKTADENAEEATDEEKTADENAEEATDEEKAADETDEAAADETTEE